MEYSQPWYIGPGTTAEKLSRYFLNDEKLLIIDGKPISGLAAGHADRIIYDDPPDSITYIFRDNSSIIVHYMADRWEMGKVFNDKTCIGF